METDLAVARRAALAGAEVGLRYFASLADLPQDVKSDGSVVTEADRAVEDAIRRVLAEARPGDAVLGEEEGQTGAGDRRWIIDPIDGTALFVAGDDRWLVLVGLEQDGRIVAGVAVVPAQRRIWWAERGGGAFRADLPSGGVAGSVHPGGGARSDPPGGGAVDAVPPGDEPRRIAVDPSGSGALEGVRFAVVPDGDLTAAERDLVAPFAAVSAPRPWRTHAALLLAQGELDLVIQLRGKAWDYAATSLIVQEAGGHFTMLGGHGWDGPAAPPRPATYARSPSLHAAASRLLGTT